MKKIITIALVSTFLFGCAGTNLKVQESYKYQSDDRFSYEVIEKASVTSKGMSIFKSRLNSKLKELGILSEDNSNKRVEITFTNYYIRPGAVRALVGVMAGADNITTNIKIIEIESGAIVGEFSVVSKNPTAMGSAKGLIEQHADKIANYIKTGKS